MELVIIVYLYIVGTMISLFCTKLILDSHGIKPDLSTIILFGLLWPISAPIVAVAGALKS